MPQKTPSWNIFLSHSGSPADRGLAEVIRRRLISDHYSVWDPAIDIQPGENWARKAGAHLDAADAMVVLMSPEAAKSPWVSNDIAYALTSPRLAECVIPVFVKRTPHSPWILEELEAVAGAGSPDRVAERVVALVEKKRAVRFGRAVRNELLQAKLKRSLRGRALQAKAKANR